MPANFEVIKKWFDVRMAKAAEPAAKKIEDRIRQLVNSLRPRVNVESIYTGMGTWTLVGPKVTVDYGEFDGYRDIGTATIDDLADYASERNKIWEPCSVTDTDLESLDEVTDLLDFWINIACHYAPLYDLHFEEEYAATLATTGSH